MIYLYKYIVYEYQVIDTDITSPEKNTLISSMNWSREIFLKKVL